MYKFFLISLYFLTIKSFTQFYGYNKLHKKYPLSKKYYQKYIERLQKQNISTSIYVDINEYKYGVIVTNYDGKIFSNIYSNKIL